MRPTALAADALLAGAGTTGAVRTEVETCVMVCPVVAVALSGFMSCASAGQPPLGNLTPADTRQQYTIVEPGKPGFCVAGITLAAAEDVDWADVRSYLEAHAEACQANPTPERGLISRMWHAYHDITPAGEAEDAVDHRVDYAFGIEVTTKDGLKHDFPPGTSVETMEEAIAKYYVAHQPR
jgi:hypothetical protein